LIVLSLSTVAPYPVSHLGSTLLALLGVLALIMGVAWLFKRLPGSVLRHNDQIKMVAHLNLGQRERLLIVEVGNEHVLLGITSQTINCLHTFQPLAKSSTDAVLVLPEFAQFMQKKI